jgi:hypothetical protein
MLLNLLEYIHTIYCYTAKVSALQGHFQATLI